MKRAPSSGTVPAAPGKGGGSQAVGSAAHQPHVLGKVCVHHTFPGLLPLCLLFLCAGIPAGFGEKLPFLLGAVCSQLWSLPRHCTTTLGPLVLMDSPAQGQAWDSPHKQQLLALSLKKYLSSWQLLTQKKYLANSLQNYLFLYFFF